MVGSDFKLNIYTSQDDERNKQWIKTSIIVKSQVETIVTRKRGKRVCKSRLGEAVVGNFSTQESNANVLVIVEEVKIDTRNSCRPSKTVRFHASDDIGYEFWTAIQNQNVELSTIPTSGFYLHIDSTQGCRARFRTDKGSLPAHKELWLPRMMTTSGAWCRTRIAYFTFFIGLLSEIIL